MRYFATWVASYIVMIAIGWPVYEVCKAAGHLHESTGWVISGALAAVAAALVISDLAGKRPKRQAARRASVQHETGTGDNR